MARNYVYSGTSNEMGSAQQLNKKKKLKKQNCIIEKREKNCVW